MTHSHKQSTTLSGMNTTRSIESPTLSEDQSQSKCTEAVTLTHGTAVPPGWELGWAQIVGINHDLTEDTCAYRLATKEGRTSDAVGLYLAVADGVGGGAKGDVASQALVKHCMGVPERLLGDADSLTKWMRLAESVVQKALREVTFSPGATTLAAAWLDADGNGHLLRVGDSRLYRIWASGVVEALTADQTYNQVGETPPPNANGEDLARMIGTGFMGEPELKSLTLKPGEALLLCSDGLHRDLDTSAIAGLLQSHSTLEQACIAMAQTARALGSEDDITVLVARRLYPASGKMLGLWERFLRRVR